MGATGTPESTEPKGLKCLKCGILGHKHEGCPVNAPDEAPVRWVSPREREINESIKRMQELSEEFEVVRTTIANIMGNNATGTGELTEAQFNENEYEQIVITVDSGTVDHVGPEEVAKIAKHR